MSETELPAEPDEPLGLEGFCHSPDEHGLSLDELGAAFARTLESGHDPYDRVAEGPSPDQDVAGDEALSLDVSDGTDPGCEVSPRSILEAMLFVGDPNNEPLTSRQVAALMRGVRPQEIDALVEELNAIYDGEGCPYRIASIGAGYALVLRDEYSGLADKFLGRIREARLSQMAIDVLAIVAYRQPLSREEVDALRGKPSGSVLAQLVRRGLLRVDRPEDNPRKPRYYTTDRFLGLFGLASLDELPLSHDPD